MTKKRTLMDIARIDLETAKTMFTREDDEMFLNICAYQSHQCIEKLLKHICYSRGIDPGRTHEIGDILRDLNDPFTFGKINPYLAVLNTWSSSPRYNINVIATRNYVGEVIKVCDDLYDYAKQTVPPAVKKNTDNIFNR